MSGFSFLLGKYIKKIGYTNQQFAKLCGIDRTLLQKYISGQRLPTDIEVFNRICNHLRLPPDEKGKLEAEYYADVYGSEVYQQYQVIRDILESFTPVELEERWNYPDHNVPEKTVGPSQILITNRKDFIHWVGRILQAEKAKSSPELYLIYQFGIDDLDSMLREAVNKVSSRMHHLVCINAELQDGGIDNLKLLRALLPMFDMPVDYNLRFYYGNVNSHFNKMGLLPNMLITSDFVVQFNVDLSRAFISTSRELREFFLQIYKDMEMHSTSFMIKHQSVMEMVAYYRNLHPCDHSLQFQPCVAYALTEEILMEVIRPEMTGLPEVVTQLCEMMGQWGMKAIAEQRPANINFFTKSGLKDFMETGRIKEFPSMFYEPLSEKRRVEVLETLAGQLKAGLIEAYILKENRYHIQDSLVVQLIGDDTVHFIVNNVDGSQSVMQLAENGLVQIFTSYMNFLKNSNNVASREETIRWIDEQAVYWRQRFIETSVSVD